MNDVVKCGRCGSYTNADICLCGAAIRTDKDARIASLERQLAEAKAEATALRFFSRVKKTESCWVWVGPTSDGYGRFSLSKKLKVGAHRYSYELHKGPIQQGMVIDHLCRNRACVNPEHLSEKTNRENLLAPGSQSVNAINARKTECPKGHPYTTENTAWRAGKRHCRACERERWHRRKCA